MVKKPLVPVASTAALSTRSAVRRATIGPRGGSVSPKRLRSALENGRSHANALSATYQVRLPKRTPSVTSGRAVTMATTSSGDTTPAPYPPMPWGFGWNGGTGTAWHSDPERGLTGRPLTSRAMTSPEPPRHFVDYWKAACGAREG